MTNAPSPAPYQPTDAELLAGILTVGHASTEPAHRAIAGILARQSGRLAFGAELDAALSDQAAEAPRARTARLRALALSGAELQGSDAKAWAMTRDMQRGMSAALNGQSAGMLARFLDLGSDADERLPRLLSVLDDSGVAFTSNDLREIALMDSHSIPDRGWAVKAMRARASPAKGAEISMADAKESAKNLLDDMPNFFSRADDGSVELALELRAMGWASKSQMSEMLGSAAAHGSLEACQALAAGGAGWGKGAPSPNRRGAFASGIRRLLRVDSPDAPAKAVAFIDGLAKLGAFAGADAQLDDEDGCELAYSSAPYAAAVAFLGTPPMDHPSLWREHDARRTTAAEARAVLDALRRAGLDIDAGKGLALRDASQRVGATAKLDFSHVDLLLAAGADPKACGPCLFLAPAAWGTAPGAKGLTAWLAKLDGLGMRAADIPRMCATGSNPAAMALRDMRPLGFAAALLAHGAPPSWRASASDETMANLLAARGGAAAMAMMEGLLRDPAVRSSIDLIPWNGVRESALMRACFRLDAAMAKILLDAGADPNLQDPAGLTALHHAGRKFGAKAQDRTLPLIQLLISRGADPSLRNAKGLTPGQAMAAKGPLGAMASLLESRPDDLLGTDPAAKSTQAALARRGGQAVSAVEEAILKGDKPAAEAPKAKPRRI